MRTRALLASVVLLAACNAITGLSEEYRIAPTAPDSGATGETDGASTSDTGLPVRPDSGSPDGAPGSFCDTAATGAFCTDFEDPTLAAPAFGWDTAGFEKTGGDFAIEPNVGKNGSRGLRFRVKTTGGSSMKVSLWRTFEGAAPALTNRYELRFDFKIAASTMDYAAIATMAFPQQAGGLLTAGLAWYGDYLDTSSPPNPGDANRFNAAPGSWHAGKVVLTKEPAAATFALEVAVDDVVVDRKAGFAVGNAASAQIRVGGYFTSLPAADLDIVFDNVVAERK
jgi:hypothetical protein